MITLIDFNALIKRHLKRCHMEIVFSHYSSLRQFKKLLKSLNTAQLIELKAILQKLIDTIDNQLKNNQK